MLSLEKIEESILELENLDTSFSVCQKLADLYCVRDHLKKYETKENRLELSTASEFLKTANGRNTEKVFSVVNELVETVKVLHPKAYASFIDKIKDI